MTAVLLLLATVAQAPPLHAEVDRLIAAGPNYPASPAGLADDAEFLRRATLDLTGTIPSTADVKAFQADTDTDKRAKLVNRLLASYDHADFLARTFDVVFMDRRKANRVDPGEWHGFLQGWFASNKPYDQLVRQLLYADGSDPKMRAPARFWLDREPRQFEPYQMTRDIGRLFLGKNMQCAQCHDHPSIDDYKQADFYGIYAYFNRVAYFNADRANPKSDLLVEKPDGETTYQSVFDKSKTNYTAVPHILDGPKLSEPKLAKGEEYKVKPAKNNRPVPAFSRREALADSLIASPAFARTAVNRFWYLVMGRGLVHPLDLDHSDNPPSHPELLDLLAKEFADHHYDVRWLLRELTLSQTYQRASEAPSSWSEIPEPETFALAILKPLSAEQLTNAVLRAAGSEDAWALELGPKFTPQEVANRRSRQAGPFVAAFAAPAGEPESADFQATLTQALFFANGSVVRSVLTPSNGNLTHRLANVTDPTALAEEVFLSVLSRRPAPEETAGVAQFLKDAPDRKIALQELAATLMATAEFRFNH